MRCRHLSIVLSLLAFIAVIAPAQTVPPGFVVETFATVPNVADSAPYDFGFIPDDGRMIILSRGGLLTIVANGSQAMVGTIPTVETGSERGALSLAIDPNFATNHYIYVWYSTTASAFMRLSRFELGGTGIANPASTAVTLVGGSERFIISDAPDNAFNHNGGTVRFGPDGMLYLSIGDDANSCTAQNRNTLDGDLLRMTLANMPTGGGAQPARSLLVPADNPDAGNVDPDAGLNIAFGLRNPVTFNIDPVTGDIFIADVGQNAREEFDLWPRNMGGMMQVVNFGWPWREGIANFSTCPGGTPPNLVNPIDDYPQASGGVSIMAGGLIRNLPGQQFQWPAAYENNVFHVDFFNGTMERLQNVGGTWQNAPSVPGQFGTNWWGGNFQGCWHFQQYNGTVANPGDGAIYFCRDASVNPGQGGSIMRMRPATPLNQVNIIQGNSQFAVINSNYSGVLEVEVRDPMGINVLPGLNVTFTITAGNGSFTSPSVVVSDINGRATVSVLAGNLPGALSIRATVTGGDTAGATFSLFNIGLRVIDIAAGANRTEFFIVTTTTNQVAPVYVPYLLMAGLPQTPLQVPILGSLCLDPLNTAATIIIADGLGFFPVPNLVNPIGNPNLSRSLSVPAAAVSGQTFVFNAIGYDPSLSPATFGYIVYNCVSITYP